MKMSEAINRGFNLMSIALVALPGLAFVPEIFLEKDWDDKGDDILLAIVALLAIWWYFGKDHRYQRSMVPVVFVWLALLTKIMALVVEFHDAEAVGDDIGALIVFGLATIFVMYQFWKTKQLLATVDGSGGQSETV